MTISKSLKLSYINSRQQEFRRAFKLSFYAWCYGSHKHDLVWQDFKLMYDMGGEL